MHGAQRPTRMPILGTSPATGREEEREGCTAHSAKPFGWLELRAQAHSVAGDMHRDEAGRSSARRWMEAAPNVGLVSRDTAKHGNFLLSRRCRSFVFLSQWFLLWDQPLLADTWCSKLRMQNAFSPSNSYKIVTYNFPDKGYSHKVLEKKDFKSEKDLATSVVNITETI